MILLAYMHKVLFYIKILQGNAAMHKYWAYSSHAHAMVIGSLNSTLDLLFLLSISFKKANTTIFRDIDSSDFGQTKQHGENSFYVPSPMIACCHPFLLSAKEVMYVVVAAV